MLLINQTPVFYQDGQMVTCEVCGAQVTIPQTHSANDTLTQNGQGMGAYQCNAWQHFTCCREHALVVGMLCYIEHMAAFPYVDATETYTNAANYQAIVTAVDNYVTSARAAYAAANPPA